MSHPDPSQDYIQPCDLCGKWFTPDELDSHKLCWKCAEDVSEHSARLRGELE